MNANDSKRYRRSAWGSLRARRARSRRGLATFVAVVVVIGVAIAAGVSYLLDSEPSPSAAALAAPADEIRKAAERTAALPPLNLPADDAPHGSAMEWWYYNGILDAKGEARYAFHMVVFVANGLVKHTAMHAALTDLQTGKRYVSQTRTAGIPWTNVPNGFDFRQEGWQATGSPSSQVLRVKFDDASIAIDASDAGPTVAHRAPGSETPGLLDFGTSGISYYYSRPRLSAQGAIAIGGKSLPVSGEVWFDHQWGEFDVLSLGWNWFALHLSDGSDLMLYQLFDMNRRKVMTAGTLSNANGSVPLKPGEVELTPGATWTSPKTNIPYVVEWSIKLPSGVLNVKPFVANSEFDSGGTTSNVYWEGPVKVSGNLEGQGFLELSGYDRLSATQPTGK